MELIEELIRGSINGDEASQRALFKRYRELVLRITYRQLGQSEDLDEAVQEIFIQMFRSLPKFKGGSKFETWVYRIGLNVCTDVIRRKMKKRRLMIDPTAADRIKDFADKGPDALDEIISGENQREIYDALNTLDKSKRAVIILHDVEDKPIEEISAITGVPPGTVKSRLFYARKMLKSALASSKLTESYCEHA
ncbi:MAG: sigma-70 family RNA polymerase sigma factor [Fibrobacteres bacterium]|nr:sigma-70 family RNA polymerase sigma factor [Fibrobacterota bacterium]